MDRACDPIVPIKAIVPVSIDISIRSPHIGGPIRERADLKPVLFIAISVLVGFSPTRANANHVPRTTNYVPRTTNYDDVRLAYFRVEEQGSDFVIVWEAEVEENIKTYEVQRRSTMTNGRFVVVKEYEAAGVQKQYVYTDDQVFKTASDAQDMIDYQLVVVYQTGVRQIIASKSVNYTSTALRRTWGSIKAMF